ncbi:PQQ-like beta-propeller repeat protein [Cellulomonas fimi]|uniref:outer membrane protein assembly factor BamB family protein n=1 Tax=Cellulomonas fimi TaxID=1708 RepID=UPI00234E2670|nr:PQQ-binding-like beta-propeller repeat protein [Cellulomonas fimi]MDC7121456.1 PQQ-like beta-propeller repeat protein [Cellulomonas fimi]
MSGRMQDVHLVEVDEHDDGPVTPGRRTGARGDAPRRRGTRPAAAAAPHAPGGPADPDDPAAPDTASAAAPDVAAGASGDPRDPAAAARGWVRRHLRVLVPAVVAVAALLVGAQALLDARERARVDALADVRGVLRPVDPGLAVRWAAGAEDARVVESGVLVAGLVVGVAPLPAAQVQVRALDERTGALRWTRDLDLPTPLMTLDAASPATWTVCTTAGAAAEDAPARPQGARPPVVACLAQQPGSDIGPAPDVSLWFLDARDGTVLSTRRLPGDTAFTVLDGRFLTATRVDEQEDSTRWRVTATDPATRDALWTWTTPRIPAPRVTQPTDVWSSSFASLDARGDRVLLAVGSSSWLLDADGALLRRDRLEPGWWPELARGGAVVHSTWSEDGRPQSRLLRPDGTRATVDATPLWLTVDDGSAPGAVLFATRDVGPSGVVASVSARDASSGDLRWRVTGLEATSAVLLDEHLYVVGSDGLAAIDARTGRVVWTTPLARTVDEIATDGRWLLLRGPGPVVEAYATADGGRAWRADLTGEALEAGTSLRVGWQVPRMYALRTDGSVAVLG